MAEDIKQLVFSAAPDAKEYPGLVITDFDEKGAIASRNPFSLFFGGPRKRIGVLTRQHRQGDVTGPLHDFLEERLLRTGETIKREKDAGFRFTVEMSIGTDSDAEAIARAHWHPTMRPFKYFIHEFGRKLKSLLESEAERSDMSIDQNIAANHQAWQKYIANELSRKFHVDVAIFFRVPPEPSPNVRVQIGRPGSSSQKFLFKDSVDEGVVIPVTAHIAPHPDASVLETFPKDEAGQNSLLVNLIYRILSESFLLAEYWYDVDGLTERLTAALNARMARYGRRVISLNITGSDNVPEMQVRAECNCTWRDSYGVELPFPVTGFVSIASDGAGKFHRAGRPDREDLFRSWIDDELRRALAGMTVIDLSETVLEDVKAQIAKRLEERAQGLGLTIEPFLAEPRLPFENWTRLNLIEIEPDPPYRTAHPKISAEFSTSIQLKFRSRKALKPFVEQLKTDSEWTSEDFDARVESQLKAIAIDATKLVMQGVSAEDYFSNFTRWDLSLPSVSAPALEDEHGESQVRKKIVEMLKAFNADIEVAEIRFHRTDTVVEKLRNLIGRMGRISVNVPIKDRVHFDQRYDRTVKLHVNVISGVPEMLVTMLMGGVQDRSENELATSIRTTLIDETEIALDKATYNQLESLIDSLAFEVEAGEGSLRALLTERLKRKLKDVHGLETDITMHVGLTEYEVLARTSNFGRAGMIESARQLEQRMLFEELETLTADRAALTNQSSDSLAQHERISKRIEVIKKQLAENADQGGPATPSPIVDAARIGARELLQLTSAAASEEEPDKSGDNADNASHQGTSANGHEATDAEGDDAPVTLDGEVSSRELATEADKDAADEDPPDKPSF